MSENSKTELSIGDINSDKLYTAQEWAQSLAKNNSTEEKAEWEVDTSTDDDDTLPYEALNDGQKKIFDAIANGRDVFISGEGGSGKTTVVKTAIRHLENVMGKDVVVCAPTAIAALNYGGGSTIHSVFGLGIGAHTDATAVRYSTSVHKKLINMDVLIIDEISMVRCDIFDQVVRNLDLINKIRRGDYPDIAPIEPLPPVQVIALGDLAQLPPVVKGPEKNQTAKSEQEVLDEFYREYTGGTVPSRYFPFEGIKWNDIGFSYYFLYQNMRVEAKCEDEDLIKNLNLARRGDPKCLPYFNSRVVSEPPEDAIFIAHGNRTVNRYNADRLKRLPGRKKTYECEDEYLTYPVTAKLKQEVKPHMLFKGLLPHQENDPQYHDDKKVELKVGAPVIFIVNVPGKELLAPEYYTRSGKLREDAPYADRVANGTRGIVKKVHSDYAVVEVREHGRDPREVYVHKHSFPIQRYEEEFDPVTGRSRGIKLKTIAYQHHMPVKLAFAMTIHKAQGQSFDKVHIDLSIPNGRMATPGLAYVALSRATNIEGLTLSSKISVESLVCDPLVVGFYRDIDPIFSNGVSTQEALADYERFLKDGYEPIDFDYTRRLWDEWKASQKNRQE